MPIYKRTLKEIKFDQIHAYTIISACGTDKQANELKRSTTYKVFNNTWFYFNGAWTK